MVRLPIQHGEVLFDLQHRELVMELAVAMGQLGGSRPWAADVCATNAADGRRFDQFEPVFHIALIRCYWPKRAPFYMHEPRQQPPHLQ